MEVDRHCSVKAEYLYAEPGNPVVNSNALQSIVLPADTVFGSATAQTTSRVHENRVGVNYCSW